MKDRDSRLDDKTLIIDDVQMEQLRKLSGGHQACLIVLAGGDIGRQVELQETETILGRSLTAGIRLDNRSVSRQHAKILRHLTESGDSYEVVDLGSVNGIRVNNEPVQSTELHDGDKIQLGDVVFKFSLSDAMEAQYHKEVHRRIHYDQLTGLLTLTSFYQQLDAEMHKSSDNAAFTLAMTDLDGLKKVNDTHGHLAGAMAVGEMGSMIRSVLRPDDRGGLYGGDETILLFPKTRIAEAAQLAERIRTTIAARVFEHRGKKFGVTISQGLAEWPRDGKTLQEIVAAADGALYAAKAAGRNCVRCVGEQS